MFQRRNMITLVCLTTFFCQPVQGQLTRDQVARSLQAGVRYLKTQQQGDGHWGSEKDQFHIGITSLALMAMLNSQVPVTDVSVQKGLGYLRSLPPAEWPRITGRSENYELSLMLMALAVADQDTDRNRIIRLASLIENGQVVSGANVGGWSYRLGGGQGGAADESNSQYSVLALREAAHYGVPVKRETWVNAQRYWQSKQSSDGGWGYQGSGTSSGSMTVAGIASSVICETMLGDPDDNFNCCQDRDDNQVISRGIEWLSKKFSIGSNPGKSSNYLFYYLYGLERAGRLSGRRFFGENNDWYRAGSEYLIKGQSGRGFWSSQQGGLDGDQILSTTFAMLFLSKGLSPVVISKLKFGGGPGAEIPESLWNQHPRDVHHLMDFISTQDGWPKLLTWQVLELPKLTDENALSVLVQSPILYLASDRAPQLTPDDIRRLRQYLDQGGTLLAAAGCQSAEFDDGFRRIVKLLYPEEANLFKRLTADHPVYRSEFLLSDEAHKLWGIDFGCRTPIIYSPDDIGCLWDHWSQIDPPGRSPQNSLKIDQKMKLGTNIVAYVTGREPADKLESQERAGSDNPLEAIERGFLQIAKLRHEGGWDTAPMALRNLLKALNEQVGAVSTTKKNFVPSDQNIFNFPMLYIHGRQSFSFSEAEREQLRKYLNRDGVLFADACCGASQFDVAFRKEIGKLFPNQKLTRIPVEHELMQTPFDIRQVTRRLPSVNRPGQPLKTLTQKGEPVLYGIEIDGRLAVIYSQYDLSCALERQTSLICNGYSPEDALHIAMNIVIYSQQQSPSIR
ncbi:MAG: DUF4159 domain-containing protein [Planctomycetaceae bacterium]|jgi:hypothetical protein|nr:DUF4159 domain-containing protein [Planctomycetaceae bacterium]MDG2390325.1 DUF4159 domain-containing protein [Planctomycetaceae bacterium]